MFTKYLKLVVLFCLASHSLMGMGFDPKKAYDQAQLIKNYPILEADIKKALQEGVISHDLEQFQSLVCSEFRTNLLKSMGVTAFKNISLVWGATAIYAIFIVLRANSNDQSVMSAMLNENYMGMPIPVSSVGILAGIGIPLKEYVPSFWRAYMENTEFDKKMGAAEKKYLRFKVFYSKSLQHQVERALGDARSGSISRNIDFVDEALKLPVLNKPIPFSIENLNKFNDDVLAGYNGGEEFTNAIKLLCFDRAQLKGSHRKGLVYFYGKPGTGKTYLAHKIANFLNVELAEVPLANATVEALSGIKRGTANASEGRILQALCNPLGITDSKQNSRNMILFFDEAEKVLNDNNNLSSYMLKILDPDQETFYSPYFNSNIDISNLLIILCGNEPIKLSALKNRMQNIEFKGFKSSYRKTAIKEFVMELPSHDRLSTQEFYTSNKQVINQLVDSEEDPGFRVLHRNIRNLYNKKILERYGSQATLFESNSSASSELVSSDRSRPPIPISQKKNQ